MSDHHASVQGFQTETTEDGILIVRVDNVHRETVDALCEVMHKFDLEGSAIKRHNRSMVVLSGNAYPTPYATQRMIALAKTTPEGLQESQAIVITDTIVARLVRMLLNKLDSKARQAARLFFNEEDGLRWLSEREQIVAGQKNQQIQP